MNLEIDCDGLKELEKQLGELNLVTQKRILKKAARESARPIAGKIRSGILSQGHIDTSLLYYSVRQKTSIPKRGSYADVISEVGIYRNKLNVQEMGKKIEPPTYAYWLEFGVEPHAIGSGTHPGFTAKPFIRPAFDENIDDALSSQKKLLGKTIDRAIKRARKNRG